MTELAKARGHALVTWHGSDIISRGFHFLNMYLFYVIGILTACMSVHKSQKMLDPLEIELVMS